MNNLEQHQQWEMQPFRYRGGGSLKRREAGPPGPSPGSATDQSINTRKSDTKLFEMAKEKLPLPSLLELGKFRFR